MWTEGDICVAHFMGNERKEAGVERQRFDMIRIKKLRVRTVVGIFEWEKSTTQEVDISLGLYVDLSVAGRSDDIGDTVDYKKLKKEIMSHVEHTRFGLIERLAEEVADICLRDEKVQGVDVEVDKLGALRFAQGVCVAIYRTRPQA